MDKLKKQIFIILAILLLLSAGALALLAKRTLNTACAVGQTAHPQENTSPSVAQAEKNPPSNEDDLTRFFDEEQAARLLAQIKTDSAPTASYAAGVSAILNKHNRQAQREISEYKQAVNRLWNKYHPQTQEQNNQVPLAQPAPQNTPRAQEPQPTAEAPADTLARTSQTQAAPSAALPEQERPNRWENVPCREYLPTDITPQGIVCMKSELGFCARFENGRPYFCQTQDGQMQYLLNQWGSSITVKQNGPIEKTFYYADGKLTRYTQKNPAERQITQLWLSTIPLRMTLTDLNGKVLDKYYFTPDKPYVRYPGGNDMGEENGPWEEKDGQIWTDGRPLFALPASAPAPNVCSLFPGVCKTQDGQELL